MISGLLPVALGGGLVLHASCVGDAEEAYAVVDAERARLREWLPWVDTTTSVEVEREFLATVVEPANDAGTGLHVTIRDRGGFAGFAGLRLFGPRRAAEVGYWLAEAAVGRGLMVRSVAWLVDLALGPLEMHRVEILAAVGNRRSRAIPERLGFHLEGIRREGEELARGFVDLAMYAVLASEWPGSDLALRHAADMRENA